MKLAIHYEPSLSEETREALNAIVDLRQDDLIRTARNWALERLTVYGGDYAQATTMIPLPEYGACVACVYQIPAENAIILAGSPERLQMFIDQIDQFAVNDALNNPEHKLDIFHRDIFDQFSQGS